MMKTKKHLKICLLMLFSLWMIPTSLNQFDRHVEASGDLSAAQSLPIDTLIDDETEEEFTPEETQDELERTPSTQWNHSLMNINAAWADGYTGRGVKVAILDTGFYAHHPEINFAGGESLFDDDPWTNDHTGHGTHIAGIVGANKDSEFSGISPDAQLYGIKIYHRDHVTENGAPYTDVQSMTDGIYAALKRKAQIIVISSSVPEGDSALHKAVQTARQKGALIIAAGGNQAEHVQYPAAYDEVLAVASVDEQALPTADFTSGPENDFVAPGKDIGGLSTPDSPYGYPYVYMSGSSQAAPHVAGLAAILTEKYQGDTEKALSELTQDAAPQDSQENYGYGLAQYVSEKDKMIAKRN